MDEELSDPRRIVAVGSLFPASERDIPEQAGLYAFWWLGDKSRLLGARLQIELKGPGGRWVSVEYKDWWPESLPYPCLYIGKTIKLSRRFTQHILPKFKEQLHKFTSDGHQKQKAKISTCQLRYGIEHVFRDEQEPLRLIKANVGFSWSTSLPQNAVEERFFAEDRLIGQWRPWFNIDSER